MKAILGLTLLCISLFHCFSSTYASDCPGPINVPAKFHQHCSGPNLGYGVGRALTKAVAEVSVHILAQCKSFVGGLCESLPDMLQKYTAGGIGLCKADLKEALCDEINNNLGDTYCFYKKTIIKILSESNRWVQGKEKGVCALFEANPILCSTVKERLCKNIDNELTKSYCHKFMKKAVC